MLKITLTRIARMLVLKGGLLKFAAALAGPFIMITGTANAQLVTKTFAFGPGTPYSSGNFRTFYPPAGATVDFLINMDDNPGPTIPVVIELFRADATSVGATGPHGPLTDSFSVTSKMDAIGGDNRSYGTNFGCPNSWRIRVRTANNQPPSVRISGTIFFSIRDPRSRELDMEGGTQNLDGNVTATRTLKIREANGVAVDRMGKLRIKAKWHTDAFQGGFEFYRLRVRLLRPDGSEAARQTGFSQHAPNDRAHRPRLHFAYNMTPADATQSGDWQIEIRNTSGVRVTDFDIDSILDPAFVNNSFRSLFQVSSCN